MALKSNFEPKDLLTGHTDYVQEWTVSKFGKENPSEMVETYCHNTQF